MPFADEASLSHDLRPSANKKHFKMDGYVMMRIRIAYKIAFIPKRISVEISPIWAMGAEEIQKSIAGGMGGGGFRPVADGYIVPSDQQAMVFGSGSRRKTRA